MAVLRTDSSSASIQLPNIGNDQSDLLNNSLDQIDGPTEVVILGTSEQNEIEKLEAQLAELSRQHAHHTAELQKVLAQEIIRKLIFDHHITISELMKWIVIFDAFFLFIRLVFMTDIFVVFALFNLISLILLVVGYKCEQHYFFWPFVLSCAFDMYVACLQGMLICLMFFLSRLSFAKHMDLLYTPVLAEQVADPFDLLKIFVYALWKFVVFEILFSVASVIGYELALKKRHVAKEQKCLAKIESQKIAIDRQLELLRANKSNCPIDS